MQAHEIIRRPIITEKSNFQADLLAQYSFEVDLRANKAQIKQAVEQVFEVKVDKVRTMIVPAKRVRRYGRRDVRRKSMWKKAIITLKPGYHIEFFEGV